MNWDAIGAIAELLGAMGVIFTLAYLAIQIRHSSDQLEKNIQSNRLQANDSVFASYDSWRQSIIDNEELADIYIRGLNSIESLSESERLRFNFSMSSFIWTSFRYWSAEKEELVSNANIELFGHLMRHSGGREWYKNHREYLDEGFRAMLDSVQDEISQRELPDLDPEESSSMFAGALQAPNTK
jgi:hypothetical protein